MILYSQSDINMQASSHLYSRVANQELPIKELKVNKNVKHLHAWTQFKWHSQHVQQEGSQSTTRPQPTLQQCPPSLDAERKQPWAERAWRLLTQAGVHT